MMKAAAIIQSSKLFVNLQSQLLASFQHLRIPIVVLAAALIAASCCWAKSQDGPAELPRATVPSAMSDTPARGSVLAVKAGEDLQSALNNANCGDIIELQAGAVFNGPFFVPAKNCDINHWIWIRTSSPDRDLPAEGQRATPCYAGFTSLEGRPHYNCPVAANVMAMVQMPTSGDGPFVLAPGAKFYRFIGLEINRPAGLPRPARLIRGNGADHIVIDRSWLHGAAQDETYEGVSLNGMTHVAIVDSYFSDFHCISRSGFCTDSQAIQGGTSNTQDGPFKIEDNFLEAAGEAVMFGGGSAKFTPTDIEILGNHFWKPWQWRPGNRPFVGGADGHPFVVKNQLELKNAIRVLVDGNLIENTWGGFSQNGSGILLTPKSQHKRHGGNSCPKCQVTDITIRYVQISHGGGGIQMATSLSGSGKNGGEALAGTRWSLHDIVMDDISSNYVGLGNLFLLMNNWEKNPLNTVTINHVTGFADTTTTMLFVGNIVRSVPMYGLVFTNNLLLASRYPVWNTGKSNSCAADDVPVTTIKKCFKTFTFANNAIIAPPPQFPPSTWPANNMFPKTIAAVNFTSFNDGDGGNYELQPGSLYKNAGTDGKDLGADIVGLNAELANVE